MIGAIGAASVILSLLYVEFASVWMLLSILLIARRL
jgi:hypothetical protein